jgi:phage tail tape-measure protein
MLPNKSQQRNSNKNENEQDLVNGTVSASAAVGSLGVAVGAAVGMMGGPLGMVAGAMVGGGLGLLAGSELVDTVNPEEEVEYWRINHKDRNYFNSTTSYDAFSPAYRFGIDSYARYCRQIRISML